MIEYQMGISESKFADIIWTNAPISSGQLVKLAKETLGWQKSTTYTVLKRLCDKGIFKNDDGNVLPLISKEDFFLAQSEKLVNDSFDGSLPAFLAAFMNANRISDKEAEEIQKMIETYRNGN